MRKFLPILTLAFASLFIYSCDNNTDDEVQYVDNDTYSGVVEITRSFQYNSGANKHFINQQIGQYGMQDSDVALVYRLKSVYQGNDVWEQIPKTIYEVTTGREVDYDFDFTKNDVQIYVSGNFDVTTAPNYYSNQTFRIVLVPAGFLKSANSPVDHSDYNAVIKYYNIDDSKVVKIN